jgi:acyl carrier protein
MGLDTVELVMQVEEAFDITIDDRDAEKIMIVGQLYQYVLTRVGGEKTPGCLSASTFYRFRRVLGSLLDVERGRVRLSTSIDELIPLNGRRHIWPELENALELALPELQRPTWVTVTASLGVVSCIPLCALTVLSTDALTEGVAASLMMATPLLACLFYRLMRPCAVHLSGHCQTVRGMVSAILSTNYGRTVSQERYWNREAVWETLREIIAEQVGIKTEDVKEEHHFLKDYF